MLRERFHAHIFQTTSTFLTALVVWACPPAKASATTATTAPHSNVPPRAWLSEALANPAGVPDENAEFIEICGDSLQATSLGGLEIHLEGRTHRIGSALLPPGEAYVLCRDSLAASALGLMCSGAWKGLQLTNTRSLWFSLRDSSGRTSDFVVPIAREGESQENGSRGNGAAHFTPSVTRSVAGFASPGTCGAMRGVNPPAPEVDQAETFDASDLREPALVMPRLSLQNPQGFAIAVPSGFAKGEWRMSRRSGALVFSGKLPERAGLMQMAGTMGLESVGNAGRWLSPGPYVITLAKGRKRWHAVMTVIP